MKTKENIALLRDALEHIQSLKDACHGKRSRCGVDSLERVPRYLDGSVIYPLEKVLKDLLVTCPLCIVGDKVKTPHGEGTLIEIRRGWVMVDVNGKHQQFSSNAITVLERAER